MPLRNYIPVASLFIFGLVVITSAVLIRVNAVTPSTNLTIDNVNPTVVSVKLCAGTGNPSGCAHESNVVLTGGTTTTYSIAGVIEDANGIDDIVALTGYFGRTFTGCPAPNLNSCYQVDFNDCDFAVINATSGTYECPISVVHYAEATDDASLLSEGAYPTDDWTTRVLVQDAGNLSSGNPYATSEVNSLRDLSACSSINYGTLANGASSSTGIGCNIQNDGNVDIDIEISGTAMTCTVGSIPAGNQLADITNGSYASMAVSGTADSYTITPATYSDIVLNKRTSSVVTDDLYHTITVPFAVSGSCSGTNTISAVAEV